MANKPRLSGGDVGKYCQPVNGCQWIYLITAETDTQYSIEYYHGASPGVTIEPWAGWRNKSEFKIISSPW